MYTDRSSRRWLRIAAILVVFLSSTVLPPGGTLARGVKADNTPQAAPFLPSDAKLDRFTANEYSGKVLVEWHTGLEVDNLGFNVYRVTNGKRVRVNPQILAGSALMAGERTNLRSGYSYAWRDDPPNGKDAQYWLEAIDLNGQRSMFGPVSPERAQTGDGLAPARGRALLLSGIGKVYSASSAGAPVSRFAAAPQINAQQLAVQSDLAGGQAIKLSVNQEGWYRVSQPELVAAGLDQGIDPRMLHLTAGGLEQHFIVNGEEDGRFDPSDYIEFYGLGLNSPATDTRVYWLAAGAEPGRRVQRIKGKGSRPSPASVTHTIERRDRTIYFSALRNGGKENFFGAVVAGDPVDQVIRVDHLDLSTSGDALIEVGLQGVTTLEHRVKVELNGVVAGDIGFVGQVEGVGSFRLPQTTLREGENTVTLTALGADSDVSLVGYIRITYSRALVADSNGIRFNLANKRRATIGGFTSPAIRVWDITEPDEIRQVTTQVQQQGEEYSVTVSAPKPAGRTLWAVADDQARRVASIDSNRLSNLRGVENAADLVIIAHKNFLESIGPLKTLRERQGLKVSVVDVEDVYDEFSYGEKTSQSIQDFLLFARTYWRTAPRFALFVGDASLDPKNYLGKGDYDFVPSRFVDTLWLETVSDECLADFDGDGLAEMALGRLPVRTATEASRIVDKIVSYDSAPMPRSVLLVSDLNDGIDFQSEFSRVRQLVPDDVYMTHIDRGELGTPAAKSQLIESLNRGLGIISYFGHGSIDQWRGDLLTSADAGALVNGEIRPLVFAITCLNGYFQDPALDSLAESFLNAERGGAVAVWASSGMCDSGPQATLDQEMFRIIFTGVRTSGDTLTLGEAAMRSKRSIRDVDVRLTYILFGDPTTRIK